jgi:predicted acyl esterase
VWWAQQGYVVINLDTRGGGHSEGCGNLLSDQEADDISQVIEWAAAQPWSTGKVGMLRVSYRALSQYKVAALNPPALRAICPWEGFTDAYRDFFTRGGVVENGFARVWLFLTGRVARLETNFAAERRKHPLHDAWWEEITPDLSKITVPILECTSFSDNNLQVSDQCEHSNRLAPRTGTPMRTVDPSGPRSMARRCVERSSPFRTVSARPRCRPPAPDAAGNQRPS